MINLNFFLTRNFILKGMEDESDLDSVRSGTSHNSYADSTNEGADDSRNHIVDVPYDDDSMGEDNEDDAGDQDRDISSQGGDTGSINDDYDEDQDLTDRESDDHIDSPDKLSYSREDDDEASNEENSADGDDYANQDDQSRSTLHNSPSNEFEDDDEDVEDEMDEEMNLSDEEDATQKEPCGTESVTGTPVEAIVNAIDSPLEEEALAIAVEVPKDLSSQDTPIVAAVVTKKTRKKPTSSTKKKTVSPKKSKSSKKKSPGRQKISDSDLSSHTNAISRERLEAAQQARNFLISTVGQIPFTASDSHIVQNFGRIKVEDSESPLFSTPTSLFPVGFICDRYEFSPVHGRVIKMRCEILDGNNFEENAKAIHGLQNYKGPIFRISWGEGIDELRDGKPFPFDVYSSCSPLMNGVDTIAVPLGFRSNIIKPEKDMRVLVRFDNDSFYRGTIRKVISVDQKREEDDSAKKRSSKKKQQQTYKITIKYDDGLIEETLFPDPDISLVSPGKFRVMRKGFDVTLVLPCF